MTSIRSTQPMFSDVPAADIRSARAKRSLLRSAARDAVASLNRGWSFLEYCAWADRYLVRNQWLSEVSIDECPLVERGCDTVGPKRAAGLTEPQIRPIFATCRERVLDALSGMLRTPQDDRFVAAALYGRRVERIELANGGRIWAPRLQAGQALSDWILAIFAADAMGDRRTYDEKLAICEVCGRLTFSAKKSRKRCKAHERQRCSVRPEAERGRHGRVSPTPGVDRRAEASYASGG